MQVTAEVLQDIENHDPDGWEHREPRALDFLLFEAWARRTYGDAAWQAYVKPGGWREAPEV